MGQERCEGQGGWPGYFEFGLAGLFVRPQSVAFFVRE